MEQYYIYIAIGLGLLYWQRKNIRKELSNLAGMDYQREISSMKGGFESLENKLNDLRNSFSRNSPSSDDMTEFKSTLIKLGKNQAIFNKRLNDLVISVENIKPKVIEKEKIVKVPVIKKVPLKESVPLTEEQEKEIMRLRTQVMPPMSYDKIAKKIGSNKKKVWSTFQRLNKRETPEKDQSYIG